MTEIIQVHDHEGAVMDVVFVHGLDGDAKKTWSRSGVDGSFWPAWLGEELDDVAVWSVDYDASSSRWRGHSMPILDRATNVAEQLLNYGIGKRPICFVAHSMGGLLVKEILLVAAQGMDEYAKFAEMTKGIVFLATPHTGSDLTAYVDALGRLYRATEAVDDLGRDHPYLRKLNADYRNWVAQAGVRNKVFFEKRKTKGMQVVSESSADPGLVGVRAIGIDADHITICKPENRNSPVYKSVARFVGELKSSPDPPEAGEQVKHVETNRLLAQVAAEVYAAEEWPFQLLAAVGRRKRGYWRAALDGSVLTPDHAVDAVIAPRRVLRGEPYAESAGKEMDWRDFAGYLAGDVSRPIIMLAGDTGDGKDSYLSLLAANTAASHVFLRYPEPMLGDVVDLTTACRFGRLVRHRLGAAGVEEDPAVIVCVPYSDTLFDGLFMSQIRNNALALREITLVVDGRSGQLAHLYRDTRVVSDWVELGSLNADEAHEWVDVLDRVHVELIAAGLTPEELGQDYPNFHAFRALSVGQQIDQLVDDSKPMLVRLLESVYGQEMWKKLVGELNELGEADKNAYLHVSLASLARTSLTDNELTSLAPDTNYAERCQQNPWSLTPKDEHQARHRLIAQTVLEHADIKDLRACVDRLVSFADHPSGRYLDIVGALARAVSDMRSIGLKGRTKTLQRNIKNYLRRSLGVLRANGRELANLILSREYGNVDYAVRWADVLTRLITSKNLEENAALLDAVDALLEEYLPLDANDWRSERIAYYLARNDRQRLSLSGPIDWLTQFEIVEPIGEFIGAEWCNGLFYHTLVLWADEALGELPIELLAGCEAVEAEKMYRILFRSYQWCRVLLPPAMMSNKVPNAYVNRATYTVNRHFPDQAEALVAESWQTSVEVGSPDPETACIYVDLLYARMQEIQGEKDVDSTTVKHLGDTVLDVLEVAFQAEPDHGNVLFWLALIKSRGESQMDVQLADHVRSVELVDQVVPGTAFIFHAQALLASSRDEKLELLKRAANGYRAYSQAQAGNGLMKHFNFLRVRDAWKLAVGELAANQDHEAGEHRRRYDGEAAR